LPRRLLKPAQTVVADFRNSPGVILPQISEARLAALRATSGTR
jgi:hypothetical protein